MQKPDMRVDAAHHLAVELRDHAKHAVRRRMLRAEIDGEIAVLGRPHAKVRARVPRFRCSTPISHLSLSFRERPPLSGKPSWHYFQLQKLEHSWKKRPQLNFRFGGFRLLFCFRFLITWQLVAGALPGAQEIEAAKFLR